MNLAVVAAISALCLILASQIQRRLKKPYVWPNWLVRTLTIIVLVLVVAYFYQRLTT